MSCVSGSPTQADTKSAFDASDHSGRSALGIRLVSMVSSMLVLAACVPGRPDRLIDVDMVGVVNATNNPAGAERTAELDTGAIVDLPRSAVELYGPGVSAGRLLLYGDDFGRIWYASLLLDESSSLEGCYRISGTAYDAPDAVIIVSNEWRGVGLRLPKGDGLVIPPEILDSEGRYRMGG